MSYWNEHRNIERNHTLLPGRNHSRIATPPLRPLSGARRLEHEDPPTPRIGATRTFTSGHITEFKPKNYWQKSSRIATICCIPAVLNLFGIKGPNVQQAWREKAYCINKITLCFLILTVMFAVGYFTVGMQRSLCVNLEKSTPYFEYRNSTEIVPWRDEVIVSGFTIDFEAATEILSNYSAVLTEDWRGQLLNPLFESNFEKCEGYIKNEQKFCKVYNQYHYSPNITLPKCIPAEPIFENKLVRLTFEWNEVKRHKIEPHTLVIYNSAILNLTKFFNYEQYSVFEGLPSLSNLVPGTDVTLPMNTAHEGKKLMECLASRYTVGYIGFNSFGCTVNNSLMILALTTILLLLFARFFMALAFHWFVAPNISRPTSTKLRKSEVGFLIPPHQSSLTIREGRLPLVTQVPARSFALPTDLYSVCLVTCYSEDKSGIRSTLDSIALTDYPDDRKLIFVICDGIIQGAGNNKTTPDMVLSLINITTEPYPEPKSYLAIADGEKQHNKAKVYGGFYVCMGKPVPTIVVVKCGNEQEQIIGNKVGNRGKRDSQVILINFLSRVNMNDRMTPLDYDLFTKIRKIALVTPDIYELVLMVDADTIIHSGSLKAMVQTMVNDSKVMGLCGETRISNKTETWVTMIQVYEYFTNHNLGKSFESMFGGVTCLPGCFCMYRIKAFEKNKMIPLLINPDIVEAYSENVVDTLHKKNLLLLGEDRFLSTLMLGTFPKRKMVFVPDAICHTTVPHTYKMLQSQRRRWINSTIHNLFELVQLPTLCGTFCFSMQFVIALELIGTFSLPIAVVLTFYLILSSIFGVVSSPLPLLLLLFTLFLPALLVLITTNKPMYIVWMFVYLLSIPIWNFALPLYAFWHFDDFSWGDTRKVEGEVAGGDHSSRQGAYEIGSVQLKTWEEWEILTTFSKNGVINEIQTKLRNNTDPRSSSIRMIQPRESLRPNRVARKMPQVPTYSMSSESNERAILTSKLFTEPQPTGDEDKLPGKTLQNDFIAKKNSELTEYINVDKTLPKIHVLGSPEYHTNNHPMKTMKKDQKSCLENTKNFQNIVDTSNDSSEFKSGNLHSPKSSAQFRSVTSSKSSILDNMNANPSNQGKVSLHSNASEFSKEFSMPGSSMVDYWTKDPSFNMSYHIRKPSQNIKLVKRGFQSKKKTQRQDQISIGDDGKQILEEDYSVVKPVMKLQKDNQVGGVIYSSTNDLKPIQKFEAEMHTRNNDIDEKNELKKGSVSQNLDQAHHVEGDKIIRDKIGTNSIETSFSKKPGDTINKFWKSVYLSQMQDSEIQQTELHQSDLELEKSRGNAVYNSNDAQSRPTEVVSGSNEEILKTNSGEMNPYIYTNSKNPQRSLLDFSKQKSLIIIPEDFTFSGSSSSDSSKSFATAKQFSMKSITDKGYFKPIVENLIETQGKNVITADLSEKFQKEDKYLIDFEMGQNDVSITQSQASSVKGPRPDPNATDLYTFFRYRKESSSSISDFKMNDDVSEISATTTSRSSVRGPRQIPFEWSIIEDTPKTSTTNKEFKEMMKREGLFNHKLKRVMRKLNSSQEENPKRVKGPREMK